MTITEGGSTRSRTIAFGEGMGAFASALELGGTVSFSGPGGIVTGSFEANFGEGIHGSLVRAGGESGTIDVPALDIAGAVSMVAVIGAIALNTGGTIGSSSVSASAQTPTGPVAVTVTVS